MVLISYGYDAHFRDPLGSLLLSAEGYYRLIAALKNWAARQCAGRVAVILEGGYDLEAGRACTTGAAAALLDERWEDPLGPAPGAESSGWKSVVEQAASRF
jgi:acetoin utilization deacetylase AcuC-like enzyme